MRDGGRPSPCDEGCQCAAKMAALPVIAAKMAALPVNAAKMAALPVNAAKMAALHTGGAQFTATADSVATSCDHSTVGRAVLGEPHGRGGVPSPPAAPPPSWESRAA